MNMETDDAHKNLEDLLSQAVEVWKNDRFVNVSPTWKQHPKGHYLAEVLAAKPECEARLRELLSHENKLVVSYSLVALEIMGSGSLGQLPDDLLDSKQLITRLKGSFAIEFELGEFAKEIQKQWRERRKQK
jgi:hypothetical protein